MYQFRIEVSNYKAEVSALYPSTETYCASYLTAGAPDFSVTITPEDITFEREKAAREDALEGLPVRKLPEALLAATLIALVTFIICVLGVLIGRKMGTGLAGKASILGGAILIAIGLEIFITGVFF